MKNIVFLLVLIPIHALYAQENFFSFKYLGFSVPIDSLNSCASVSSADPMQFDRSSVLGATAGPYMVTACGAGGKGSETIGVCRICRPDLTNDNTCPAVRLMLGGKELKRWAGGKKPYVQCHILSFDQQPEATVNELLATPESITILRIERVKPPKLKKPAESIFKSPWKNLQWRLQLFGALRKEQPEAWLGAFRLDGDPSQLFFVSGDPAVVLRSADLPPFLTESIARIRVQFGGLKTPNERLVIDFSDGFPDKPAMREFSTTVEILDPFAKKPVLRRQDSSTSPLPWVLTESVHAAGREGITYIEVRNDRAPAIAGPFILFALVIVIISIPLGLLPTSLRKRLLIVLASVAFLCAMRAAAGGIYLMEDPTSTQRRLDQINMNAEIILIPLLSLALASFLSRQKIESWWKAGGVAFFAAIAGWVVVVFSLLWTSDLDAGSMFYLLRKISEWIAVATGGSLALNYLYYRFLANIHGEPARGKSKLRMFIGQYWPLIPLILFVVFRAFYASERFLGMLLDSIYLPIVVILLAASQQNQKTHLAWWSGIFALVIIAAIVANDFGLIFIALLASVLLFVFGAGCLERSGFSRLTAGACAALALSAGFVIFVWPMHSEKPLILYRGESHEIPALSYVKADTNELRLLYHASFSRLEKVPTKEAKKVLEDEWETEQLIQPMEAEKRGRQWLGLGYMQSPLAGSSERRVEDDLLLWVYVRGPFGVPGVMVLFIVYSFILGPAVFRTQGSASALQAGCWLTAMGWFMIGGSIGANPFSGKWLPFLHLTSGSERVLSFVLLVILLTGIIREKGARETNPRRHLWHLWPVGMILLYFAWCIFWEPKRFQEHTFSGSTKWQAPDEMLRAMNSAGWSVQCESVAGLESWNWNCGIYGNVSSKPVCNLVRGGTGSCMEVLNDKKHPGLSSDKKLKTLLPFWEAMQSSGITDYINDFQELHLPRWRTVLKLQNIADSSNLKITGTFERVGHVKSALLPIELRGQRSYSGPAFILKRGNSEAVVPMGTTYDVCRNREVDRQEEFITFRCNDDSLFHVYNLETPLDEPPVWLLERVKESDIPFELTWGGKEVRYGEVIFLRFNHPQDPGLILHARDSHARTQTEPWYLSWSRESNSELLANNILKNGRPDWSYNRLHSVWLSRLISNFTSYLQEHRDERPSDVFQCEQSGSLSILRFSLDVELNQNLAHELETYMMDEQEPLVKNHVAARHRTSLYAGANETNHSDIPQGAAVAVTDAASGKIYAIASYPPADWIGSGGEISADVIKRLLPGGAPPSLRADLEARIRRMLKDNANQNFITSVIGSAWKPLLLASFAPESVDGKVDGASELSTLQIQPHVAGEIDRLNFERDCGDASSECILGLPMGPYGMEGPTRHKGDTSTWIDAKSFILDSCNKYAIFLGTLGLCDWTVQQPSGGAPPCFWTSRRDDFKINGTLFQNLPASCLDSFEFPKRFASGCVDSLTFRPAILEKTPLGRRVASLFDINIHTPAEQEEERYDNEPFLSFFTGNSIPLSIVERTNLLLSQARSSASFRPFFLGNGDNQWSSLKLAEAYSRIVTNRRVSVTFANQDSQNAAREWLSEKEDQERLKRLMGFLAQQRSASWVRPHLPPELQDTSPVIRLGRYNLRMFSKTGTALRRGGYCDSGVFAAVLEMLPANIIQTDEFVKSGIAVTIFIEDSPTPGSAAASQNAVTLFRRLWPYLQKFLETTKGRSTGISPARLENK